MKNNNNDEKKHKIIRVFLSWIKSIKAIPFENIHLMFFLLELKFQENSEVQMCINLLKLTYTYIYIYIYSLADWF